MVHMAHDGDDGGAGLQLVHVLVLEVVHCLPGHAVKARLPLVQHLRLKLGRHLIHRVFVQDLPAAGKFKWLHLLTAVTHVHFGLRQAWPQH